MAKTAIFAASAVAGLGVGAAGLTVRSLRGRHQRAVAKNPKTLPSGRPLQGRDGAGAEPGVLINKLGVELYLRHWPASTSTPKATVLLVHGYLWHSGYFQPLAELLAGSGFSVYTFDQMGHGLSGSYEGIRGYTPSFKVWVGDVHHVLAHVCRLDGVPQAFIFGESQGGALVMSVLLDADKSSRVKGAILSGAAIKISPDVLPPGFVVAGLKGVSKVFPKLPVPDKGVLDNFDSAFGDPSFADKARSDPLVNFCVPRIRTAVSMIEELGSMLKSMAAATAPILLLHGLADTRTLPSSSKAAYDGVSSNDKEIRILEGMSHQLLQDTPGNTKKVMEIIIGWLDARC